MAGSFADKLDRLAQVLVHYGADINEGQYVLINLYPEAAELARRVAHHAYAAGADIVNLVYDDMEVVAAQLRHAPEKLRYHFTSSQRTAYEELMLAGGALIQLRSETAEHVFAGIDDRRGEWQGAMWRMRGRVHSQGINGDLIAWTLTYVPTKETAALIYPGLSPEEALAEYWEAVFRMTFADREDCLACWANHSAKLVERREKLNSLGLECLRFVSDRTDLTVGLSPQARWLGGPKTTGDGRKYIANVPQYEHFTTPDWRTVTGHFEATKPVMINGQLVHDIRLDFAGGQVIMASAKTNEQALQTLLKRDEGASRLGEVALAPIDSPVANEGRIFRATLFDENAACHVALGNAYANALVGGATMSKAELKAIGCNISESGVHEDIMISDESMWVAGITASGSDVTIIKHGLWTHEFA